MNWSISQFFRGDAIWNIESLRNFVTYIRRRANKTLSIDNTTACWTPTGVYLTAAVVSLMCRVIGFKTTQSVVCCAKRKCLEIYVSHTHRYRALQVCQYTTEHLGLDGVFSSTLSNWGNWRAQGSILLSWNWTWVLLKWNALRDVVLLSPVNTSGVFHFVHTVVDS